MNVFVMACKAPQGCTGLSIRVENGFAVQSLSPAYKASGRLVQMKSGTPAVPCLAWRPL